MILSGMNCSEQAKADDVAELTVRCLKATVPAEVPGCAFLSGGQSDLDATIHLDLMNKKYDNLDWNLTFSYGRALQQSALQYWGKNQEDIIKTQKIFDHRAKMNSLSSSGTWIENLDKLNIQ